MSKFDDTKTATFRELMQELGAERIVGVMLTQTPVQVARSQVAFAEEYIARPLTPQELVEMSLQANLVASALSDIADERLKALLQASKLAS